MRIQTLFAVYLMLSWPCSVLAEQAASESPPHPAHWGYEGDTGPEYWGDMAPEFAKCKSGWFQSPIDVSQIYPSGLPPIQFNYDPVPLSMENNGHTIKVNYSGKSHIVIGDAQYRLTQFHFHSPSENTAHGTPFDMVAHLVHANEAGDLAVVAVMFSEGENNQALKTMWRNLPEKSGALLEKGDKINAEDLLPAEHEYYHFMGSLTTPPCTEGVRWYVLEAPVSIGKDQLASFRSLYHGNVRPVQKLNGRSVRSSRPVATSGE